MNEAIKEAYDSAGMVYRRRYDNILARTNDIDEALQHVTVNNPSVLEIGCAYGREAGYIVTKTNHYVGIDISQVYINMAKQEIPEGEFHCVDVMEYEFPSRIDVVFAFASLLHLPKEAVAEVLENAAAALNPDGVVFLSLKRSEEYYTAVVTDDVSSRRFYYYNRQTIIDITPRDLVEVSYQEQFLKEPWFTMVLQKRA